MRSQPYFSNFNFLLGYTTALAEVAADSIYISLLWDFEWAAFGVWLTDKNQKCYFLHLNSWKNSFTLLIYIVIILIQLTN